MIYQSRLALALNLLRAILRKQLDVPPALADWLVEHAEEHEKTSYPEPGECVDADADPRTHLVLRQLGRDGAHRVARFLGLDEAERLAFNIKDGPDPQVEARAALEHAIKVFENFVVDSQDDAALPDDLGDAHRAEARTLAALQALLTKIP